MSEELLQEAEKLLYRRDLAGALEKFNCAQPTTDANRCAAGRWLAHMLTGDFEAAWKESDAIRASGAPDPQRFWSGEDLQGKRVILRCLHGLGDAVQFFRYLPLLRKMTTNLIVEVPPSFVELASYFCGVDEVVTWGVGAPTTPPVWDVQIEINELPYIFRTNFAELPVAERYLKLPEKMIDTSSVKPYEQRSLKAGLVWASGEWNPSRSVPLEALHSLFKVQGCEFWNLQGGRARQEWSLLSHRDNLHDAEECSASLVALAAMIQQLDLIITPDTLAAHLAGALGIPAYVMLERAADWRWMHERTDNPWYPTLRLIRQQQDGGWSPVISQLLATLQERVPQHQSLLLVA